MIGFMTKNSKYYVNQACCTICGGIIGDNPVRYSTLSAIIGRNAIINLVDGRVIRTGIVQAYF